MIRNGKDLRRAYQIVRFFKNNDQDTLPTVINIKREIRAYLGEEADSSLYLRIIKEDFDYYVELLTLGDDDGETTETDAEAYFRETEFIPMTYSAYDCTGRPFTCWYKVFKRRGLWMAYHCVGIDV